MVLSITLSLLSANSMANKLDQSNYTMKIASCRNKGYTYPDIVQISKKLIEYLNTNNKEAAANLMSYPLRVNFDDKGKTKTLYIKNKATFLKYYYFIFNKKTKQAIVRSNPTQILCDYNGSALAYGTVWINDKIYAINRIKM